METILPWEGVVEFITVVEQHSFTAAARKLGMSVAQVTDWITQAKDLGRGIEY